MVVCTVLDLGRGSGGVASSFQPVQEGQACAKGLWAQPFYWNEFDFSQLIPLGDVSLSFDMKGEDQLVLLEKGVIPHKLYNPPIHPEFLFHLSQNSFIRRLSLLEEPAWQSEEFFRPTFVANEDHDAVHFHNGRQHRRGVVPEHKATGGGGAFLTRLSVNFHGNEITPALRAEFHRPSSDDGLNGAGRRDLSLVRFPCIKVFPGMHIAVHKGTETFFQKSVQMPQLVGKHSFIFFPYDVDPCCGDPAVLKMNFH